MAAALEKDPDFDDLVLSTVHLGKAENSVLRNASATYTVFKFETVGGFQCNGSKYDESDRVQLDDDGDFDFERKYFKQEEIKIYHQMATPLSEVGMQIWLGSLLLADWILHNPSLFHGKSCLELGAGTGLCSILVGMFCKHVFCTDTGHSILNLCQKNIECNKTLLRHGMHSIDVRDLNWLSDFHQLTEGEEPFSWTRQEVECLNQVEIFLAADVIYDDNLTDAFFNKVLNLLRRSDRSTVLLLISIEKRLNFTISELDVTSCAYDHFRKKLDKLKCIRTEEISPVFEIRNIDTNFPQYFEYERPKELELWQIISTKR